MAISLDKFFCMFYTAFQLFGIDKDVLGSSMNICSIALTLLLIVVSWFPTVISIIYDSIEIMQFKYQS